jgi:hypothetical protein
MCVCLYLPFGCFVLNILKGDLHDMAHVLDHVLDVVGGLRTVRIDQDLSHPRMILRVDLVSGCSQFALNHTAFLLGCKNNLLGTP